MTFKQIMKTKESYQKAQARAVKLRYKLEELEKAYSLPSGTAKVEEYDNKTYVVTSDSTYWDRKLVITEVATS